MQDKIRYLNKVFGKGKLQNNGIELMVSCPSCKDSKKLKMNIRLDNGLYHCWVCNTKGRNLGRLIKMKRPDMVSEWFERFQSSFAYNKHSQLLTEPDPIFIPEDFSLIMESLRDPDAKAIRSYAHSRGISDDLLWRYRMGYSSEFRLRRRLIIPSFDEEGELNYWTGRAIDDTPYRYFNSPGNKKQIIFNEIDLDWSLPIYLVEGPLDMVKCVQLNSTCLLGSSLTEDSLLFYKLILFADDIVLCMDSDARPKQDKIAELLMSYDKDVYWVDPPAGDLDWGDLSPEDVYAKMKIKHKYNHDTKLLRMISDF
tara:strand:+ start:281 stop:1213 length:933 start_codon:yes stop_codon:yes gene_type:complete